MMKRRFLWLAVLPFLLMACDEVKSLADKSGDSRYSVQSDRDLYEMDPVVPVMDDDRSANVFFEGPSWFTYDFAGGHRIIPNQLVYGIYNGGESEFRLMILSYENPANSKDSNDSGKYRFVFSRNLESGDKVVELGPETYRYDGRLVDNKYFYYNLGREQIEYITDKEAQKSKDWTIAFKRAIKGASDFMGKKSIVLNQKGFGPGRARGAVLKMPKGLVGQTLERFADKSIVANNLAIIGRSGGNDPLAYFRSLNFRKEKVAYLPPPGSYETLTPDYWTPIAFDQKTGDELRPKENYAWLIPNSRDLKSSYVVEIRWAGPSDRQKTAVLEFSGPYPSEEKIFYNKLIYLGASEELKRCISFSYERLVDCEKDLWDIMLVTPEGGKIGSDLWKFQTSHGAIGPFVLGYSDRI